jgi:6-phosphogluconolactonase
MNTQWHVLADRNTATHAAACYLLERLEETISASGRATLAISGGSLPRSLFAHLACGPVAWDRVHLFWGR